MIAAQPSCGVGWRRRAARSGCGAATPPSRRTPWRLPLAPLALELLRLAVDLVGGGAERRRDVAAGRRAVEEVLAAGVQRHLGVMRDFSFVSTTCAETALSLSIRERRREALLDEPSEWRA